MISEMLKRHRMLESSADVRKEVEEREDSELMCFPHHGQFGFRGMEVVGGFVGGSIVTQRRDLG